MTKLNDNLSQYFIDVFKRWFIQLRFPNFKENTFSLNKIIKKEIPNNWKIVKLIDEFEIYQPETISNSLFDDTADFYVYGGGGHIGNYTKYNHKNSEVILSCRGSCGNVYFTQPYSWITGNAMVVTPRNNNYLKYYIYGYLKVFGVNKCLTGSVQKQITREDLGELQFIMPDEETIRIFGIFATSIMNKIISIRNENNKLKKLRDELLPLLMNGQVTIK